MYKMILSLRSSAGLLKLLLCLVQGYLIVIFLFPFLNAGQRAQSVQRFAVRILDCLGVALHLSGVYRFRGPLMIVSNHVSWLDVLVLHALGYCRFVAKTEISQWPLVGFLSKKTGMFFIDRNNPRHAVKLVHTLAQALQAGDVVAFFPEGTTSDGVNLLPFHSNLLQAAIHTQTPIMPLCIVYKDRVSLEFSSAPGFTGSTTFMQSVWATLGAPPLLAQVSAGDLSYCEGRTRKQWSEDLYQVVSELLLNSSQLKMV